jgi:hypothetical protein
MIFFTTNASAGYGARVFIQEHPHTTSLVGLHELAKSLSVWKGADKTVTIPDQDCQYAWAKVGVSSHASIGTKAILKGYEVEPEEFAVLVKRCKAKNFVDITPIIQHIQSEWN